MNEKIDLTKILKDCPKGWKLYSTIYGDVEFIEVLGDPPILLHERDDEWHYERIKNHRYPIKLMSCSGEYSVSCEGKYRYNVGECTLFPSKDQRDWNKFSAPWYKKLIEHKFNVGQYITDGYVVGQITSIEDNYNCYKILDFTRGINTSIPFILQDNYHLWTIQDANDGDVLCCKSGWMCIFKTLNNHTNTFSSYCFMDSDKCFFNIGIDGHTLDKKFINAYNGEIYPATKEQRDLLFQKMKEACYEWDAGKKELKLVKPKFKVGDWIITPTNDVLQITSIGDTTYGFNNKSHYWAICYCDEQCRFWTIQDAKDGDVLALSWREDKNIWEKIIIFKKYHSEGVKGLYSMPCIEGYGNTFKNGKIAFNDEKEPYYSKTWTCNLHPATKEQRDLLFQKIKEAGYKWKAETKTLYKEAKTKTLYKDTKTKTLYKVEPKFKVGDKIVNVPMKSMSGPWTQATISKITNDKYVFTDGSYMHISDQDHWELDKFNPKTLQPFDRVLVRDYNDDKWVCSIFSHIEPEDSFHCECILELNCRYCIPYNEDTKHLVGTTYEAPEYYRYWDN